MRLYKVYFQIYGKKMATQIMASSEDSAKQLVRESIQFDKIERMPPNPSKKDNSIDDIFEQFGNMFGKS